MMFGLPSLYLKLAGGLIVVLVIGGAGYKAGASRWQAKHQALQTDFANYRSRISDQDAKAQQAAREALQAQIDERVRTDANNEQVIHDLQQKNGQLASDRDANLALARRLLHAADRPAGHPMSEADHPLRAAAAGGESEDGSLATAVADVADECTRNANRLDSLIAELKPQL